MSVCTTAAAPPPHLLILYFKIYLANALFSSSFPKLPCVCKFALFLFPTWRPFCTVCVLCVIRIWFTNHISKVSFLSLSNQTIRNLFPAFALHTILNLIQNFNYFWFSMLFKHDEVGDIFLFFSPFDCCFNQFLLYACLHWPLLKCTKKSIKFTFCQTLKLQSLFQNDSLKKLVIFMVFMCNI